MSLVRGVLLAALLCGAVLAFGPSAVAENAWRFTGPESPLSPGSSANSGHVAFGPDGGMFYVYHSHEFGTTDILFTRSTDFGASWSNPVRIDTDPPGMNFSAVRALLADLDGSVYVIFKDARGAALEPSCRINVSRDRGLTWLREDTLVTEDRRCGGFFLPALGPFGTLYVLCQNDIVVSTDHGMTWSSTVQTGPNGRLVALDADRWGNAYFVTKIIDCASGCDPGQLLVTVSNDFGMTWSSSPIEIAQVRLECTPLIHCDDAGHV